jgi:hypothetical protein
MTRINAALLGSEQRKDKFFSLEGAAQASQRGRQFIEILSGLEEDESQ